MSPASSSALTCVKSDCDMLLTSVKYSRVDERKTSLCAASVFETPSSVADGDLMGPAVSAEIAVPAFLSSWGICFED